jgi:hypothetical protein
VTRALTEVSKGILQTALKTLEKVCHCPGNYFEGNIK